MTLKITIETAGDATVPNEFRVYVHRVIVSKLAFSPPQPTYSMIDGNNEQQEQDQDHQEHQQTSTSDRTEQPNGTNNNNNNKLIQQNNINSNQTEINKTYKLKLDERAEWQWSKSELELFEVFYANYGRNQRIACMYIKANSSPKFTILFSHGNAADIGLMSSFYLGLATKTGCNVFGYDYSGYGLSSGKPCEKSLYTNIEVAWKELNRRYNVPAEKVILYGQSIGTVPSVDLGSKHNFAGIILHSPLTSGLRLAFPSTKRTWFFDVFPNIDKVSKIQSPVLVIHGTEDEVIDITHGQTIHSLCPNPVAPLWVQGAGHNDIELFREYLDRIRKFINKDIVASTP